jgi:hypothetical protein
VARRSARAWWLAEQSKFAQSLTVVESIDAPDAVARFSRQSLLGHLHWLAGEHDQGGAQLRASVSDIARWVDAHPDIANRDLWFVQAAQNLAVVGDEADALAWLARAVELPSTAKSALQSGWALEQSIRTYARLGRVDLLLPALARMRESTGASWVSAFEMRQGPWFAKVRDDPRVQAEIALFAEAER